VGEEIQDLETESSEEARACRRFFEPARDELLRSFPWPFATKWADLGLVTDGPTESGEEWGKSYRMPPDCLRVRRIVTGSRQDTVDTTIPFKIARDASGLLIYTDQAEPEIEYTMREEDAGRFPYDFALALSYRLGAYLAPRLAKADPQRLGTLCLQLFQISGQIARSNALGEEHHDKPPVSDFESAR
jgi:hypothetical protein